MINPTWYHGLDGGIGSIEPEKPADLVILVRNPLDDTRNAEHLKIVMRNGRVYDGRTLDKVGHHPAKHAPFYWQQCAIHLTSTMLDHV